MLTPRTGRELGSPASEQSAYHAADQSNRAANTAVTASTAAATTGRTVAIGFLASARIRRRDALGQQRPMLQRVKEAGLGIAPCRLPARDDGAGRLIEFPVDLCVEAETRQPALHGATLALVKPDLIFGFLSSVVGKDCRIDGRRRVAGGRAQTGFGGIRTDEKSQERQRQYPKAHGLPP